MRPFWPDCFAYEIMENIISAFKVTFLLWISVSMPLVHPTTIRGQLTDMPVVPEIINYIKPYIQSLHYGSARNMARRMGPPTTPEAAIDQKIKELKPYLQDNDVGEKLELEGTDATTVIEFTPKGRVQNGTVEDNEESFHTNLKKYKNMRNKIKQALERASVPNETKEMVTRTLDELIATLVQRQCPQVEFQNNLKRLSRLKSKLFEDIVPRVSQNYCYYKGVKYTMKECRNMTKYDQHCTINGKKLSWDVCKKVLRPMDHLDDLKTIIKDSIDMTTGILDIFFTDTSLALLSNMKRMKDDFNDFTNTISNVLRNSYNISDNYEVKCTLVNSNKEKEKKTSRSKDACQDFRVCSEELREFLSVFYKSLNETAVRAFNNYAAMYEKDIVTEDKEEKKTAIATISRASNILEERVSNVFIKATSQIALDENKDRDMNIAALREYVKHTIKTVNKTVNKHLETDIGTLRARLLLAIKQDLTHDLAIDLGHFQTDVIKQICSFFVTCKGDSTLSMNLARKQFVGDDLKSNNVFVNIELVLDDELKETIVKNHKSTRKGKDTSNKPSVINSLYEKYNNTDVIFKEALTKQKKDKEIMQYKTTSDIFFGSQYNVNSSTIVTRTSTKGEEFAKPTKLAKSKSTKPASFVMSMEHSDTIENYDGTDTTAYT